jgi:predicted small lipoprotein YifL
MRIVPFIVVIAFSLCACGVKGPPSAVVRDRSIPAQLDCSPYDENCDAVDSEYVSGLDPKNPKDAARIKELEAKAAQKKIPAVKK